MKLLSIDVKLQNNSLSIIKQLMPWRAAEEGQCMFNPVAPCSRIRTEIILLCLILC